MIVRILGEGQFDVPDAEIDALNELDAAVEAAVEAGDAESFSASLEALLEGVRRAGIPTAPDALEGSDLILPPADATIDEVRDMLTDEGLIPG